MTAHSAAAAPAARSLLSASATARLCRESLLVAVAALAALVAAALVRVFLLQDGWLTLVAGREVAAHGLPHVDTLTAIGAGRRWVDQQWLAQLAFYGIWSVGGMKLVLAAGACAVEAALVGGLVAARRSGAAPWAVGACVIAAVAMYPAMVVLRAQLLALPLFVAVYALLRADSRSPSARVLLCVPLLALWANLHGSALLGAALVLVRAAGRLASARRLPRVELLRTGALAALVPVAVLATPYGLELAGYYRLMLVDAPFAPYVTEWQPTRPSLETLPFFAAAAGIALLAARRRGRLTRFELVALALLAAAGLEAHRNVVWFALAVLVSAPLLLAAAGARPVRREGAALNLAVAAAAASGALLLVTAAPAPAGPVRVGAAVAKLAARDPQLRVFAGDPWADWLLWTRPELAGRVAYDVRFELLTAAEMRSVAGQPALSVLARGYRLFVLEEGKDAWTERVLRRRGGRVVAREGGAEAILLPRR
jgi:hypothetical protein